MQLGRVVLAAVAAALLVVAVTACGSSVSTVAQSYNSPTLGFSIRYPANWPLKLVSARFGEHNVSFGTDKGFVNVSLNVFPRGTARFENATDATLAGILQAAKSPLPGRVLHSGFLSIAGVRFAEVEYTQGSTHLLLLSTSGKGGRASFLIVRAVCPTSQWSAQRATEMAILDSLRISKPRG
jgi:hypothetical protein